MTTNYVYLHNWYLIQLSGNYSVYMIKAKTLMRAHRCAGDVTPRCTCAEPTRAVNCQLLIKRGKFILIPSSNFI